MKNKRIVLLLGFGLMFTLYNCEQGNEEVEHIDTAESEINEDQGESTEDFLKKGMDIALSTKEVLGKNLLTAIKERGTDKAVEFCNGRAIVLTDSMSVELNAKVRRVSDKNRNPNNVANEKELAYINQAKQDIEASGKAKPIVFEQNGKMVGYYLIMTNAMCLQCHGDPKENINRKTLDALKRLYPEDQGTGYSTNELRGIWVIEMEK